MIGAIVVEELSSLVRVDVEACVDTNKDGFRKLGLISGAVQHLVGEESLLSLGLVVVSRDVLEDQHLLSEASLQDVFSILDLSMGRSDGDGSVLLS